MDLRHGRDRIENKAADLDGFLEQPKQIERIRHAAGPTVEDQMTERRQTAQALLKGWFAYGVENQVYAFAVGQF